MHRAFFVTRNREKLAFLLIQTFYHKIKERLKRQNLSHFFQALLYFVNLFAMQFLP